MRIEGIRWNRGFPPRLLQLLDIADEFIHFTRFRSPTKVQDGVAKDVKAGHRLIAIDHRDNVRALVILNTLVRTTSMPLIFNLIFRSGGFSSFLMRRAGALVFSEPVGIGHHRERTERHGSGGDHGTQ